jgi:2-polyprenyl-6-methoxyphenol hydroxylase-like FAD-dependent oxidoreductase
MATVGERAVVVGASMGGLLAARILSESFADVVVVEHDLLPVPGVSRRGVPQGRHAHWMLARGWATLEQLLPGLTRDLIERGAPTCDIQRDMRWYNDGTRLCPSPSNFVGLLSSRPLLEGCIRSRTANHPNVQILEATDAVGLIARGPRVTGVHVVPWGTNGTSRPVPADLVVDATGRGTQSLRWLDALGMPRPEEEEVRIAVTYTTRLYRRRAEHLEGDLGEVVGPTVANPRMAAILAQESGRWIVSIGGYLGHKAPCDDRGFVEYARRLPVRDIHDVVAHAEPLGEACQFSFLASRRRRYERLRRYPEGYLAFGDAICSLNPVYGQGMTVAALEALVLRECLTEGIDGIGPRFFQSAKPIVDIPWSIAVGGDLRLRGVEGRRTAATWFVNWYLTRLNRAAGHDADLARAFLEVANLVSPPASLRRPGNALRVAAGNAFTGRQRETGPSALPSKTAPVAR